MTDSPYPPVNILQHWADINDHLIEIVDQLQDEQLDWSPSEEQWNFRGIILHIIGSREGWFAPSDFAGEKFVDVIQGGQTKKGLKEQLRFSWERLSANLRDPETLDREYTPPVIDDYYMDPEPFDGHWIAFHRMVHDIQHRSEIMGYMSKLGIEPLPGRRRRPLD